MKGKRKDKLNEESVRIHIVDEWYLKSDGGLNFILVSTRTNKKGEVVEKLEGYYDTLTPIFIRLASIRCRKQMSEDGVKTIEEILLSLQKESARMRAEVGKLPGKIRSGFWKAYFKQQVKEMTNPRTE